MDPNSGDSTSNEQDLNQILLQLKKLDKLDVLEEKLTKIQTDLNNLSPRLEELERRISGNEKDVKTVLARLDVHEKKFVDLNVQTRKNNLMIRGIPESEEEDLYETFLTLAGVLGVDLTKKDIDILRRVPTRVRGVPRPVVVRLTNRRMKIEIMNKRKKVTSFDIGFALPSRVIYGDVAVISTLCLYTGRTQTGAVAVLSTTRNHGDFAIISFIWQRMATRELRSTFFFKI